MLLDADLHSAALSPSLAQIEVAATFVFHPLPLVFSEGPAKRFVVRFFALRNATFEVCLGQLQCPNPRSLGLRQSLTKRLVTMSNLLLRHPAPKKLGCQTQNQNCGSNAGSPRQIVQPFFEIPDPRCQQNQENNEGIVPLALQNSWQDETTQGGESLFGFADEIWQIVRLSVGGPWRRCRDRGNGVRVLLPQLQEPPCFGG